MSRPKLSIVVATYNAGATLERCLQSILSQSFTSWELLIVDGGSTDETLEIVRSQADRIAYWHSHPDSGIYDAWNQALAKASGEYVCFLGADDAWRNAKVLQRLFDAIGTSDYDIVSARGVVTDGTGRRLGTIGKPWHHQQIRRRMTICHPGALHRRDLFERFGLFDIQYRIAADYDFMLRLPACTRSLFVDAEVVTICDGGVSRRRRWSTLNEYWRIQKANPRVGFVRATLTFLDRCWRYPVARALGLYY